MRAGARKGITVNRVVPGVYETDMTNSMSEQDPETDRCDDPGTASRAARGARPPSSRCCCTPRGYVTGTILQAGGG